MNQKKLQIFKKLEFSVAGLVIVAAITFVCGGKVYAEDCSDVYTPLSSFVVTGVNNNKASYQQASSQTGVPWEMLAAIHYRETNFSHSNPSNGQGIFQFVNGEGGPYPAGPVSDAEFMRQLSFMAEKIQSVYVMRNSPNPASISPRRLTSDDQDINLIKNALYSYNGRATVYANQATQYGYNPAVQPFEGSPYVMNRFDCQRARMGIITQDYGGLDGRDTRYGAFTIYARLRGNSFWESFSQHYRWSYVTQASYIDPQRTRKFSSVPTSAPGGVTYATVKARNIGSRTWEKSSFRIGTSRPEGRPSLFASNGWISNVRPVSILENTVAPGEVGTFEFAMQSPSNPGTYNEYFNLLVEGQTWLNDPGLYFTVNVNSSNDNVNSYYRSGMSSGASLVSGDQIMSAPAQSVLVIDRDGSLTLRSNLKTSWSISAGGGTGNRLVMQTDGNLVLYSASNTPLWNTETQGNPGAWLALQTDGNLVLYSASNTPLWASYTIHTPDQTSYIDTQLPTGFMYPGQRISTADKKYFLALQTDGNLVLYNSVSKKAIWATTTHGVNVSFLALQTDGNLVLYRDDNQPVWSSRTNGRAASKLNMQPDGNLVLYTQDNRPVWATATVGL